MNAEALVLKHIMLAGKHLTIKELSELTGLTYHPIRDSLLKLIDMQLVKKDGRRVREHLFCIDKESNRLEEAKRLIEATENLEEVDDLIRQSVRIGWSRTNKRPAHDWLRAFATTPQSMANALKNTKMIPLVFAELFEIAANTTDRDWVKDDKLDELKGILESVERTYNNQLIFIRQIISNGFLWDGRHVRKYLIEKPGVDAEEILEYCTKIRELYEDSSEQ